MTDWLFGRDGKPAIALYFDRFISKEGKQIGWLDKDATYLKQGAHTGWFENGVLYDEAGAILAFTKEADVKDKPEIKEEPLPRIPERPKKPQLSSEAQRPERSGWSEKTAEEIFSAA